MAMRRIESDPPAYTEGFLRQDYEGVMESLVSDPDQALMVFGLNNTTLLHAAAYDGKPRIVEFLLDHGADVRAQETNGRTPLHDAANNGHLEVIDLLVRAGADLEAKDIQGMTPLMWGQISRTGRKDEIVALLLKLGAKPA